MILQPSLIRLQLVFVVHVEEGLANVVEQFKDVFELLFLDPKAHCPFSRLEQSFSWFERQTPLSHTPIGPQSMELSFLKTLGSLYYNVHLQHVCLHMSSRQLVNWAIWFLWCVSCWNNVHFLLMWHHWTYWEHSVYDHGWGRFSHLEFVNMSKFWKASSST